MRIFHVNCIVCLILYFSSVYTVEPHGEFDSLSDSIQDDYRIMNTLTITEEDIYDKLCSLKAGKSHGLDMIHPRVLFDMRDVIKYPLSHIYISKVYS